MNIIQMLGWLVCITINVAVDWILIEKLKKGVKHIFETIIRIVIGILYAGIVFKVRAADEHFQWVAIFMTTSFWIFFELGLNKSRGLELFYVGETAATDKFFRRNMPLYLGLKVAAAILFVVSVIQLLKGN